MVQQRSCLVFPFTMIKEEEVKKLLEGDGGVQTFHFVCAIFEFSSTPSEFKTKRDLPFHVHQLHFLLLRQIYRQDTPRPDARHY